MKVPVNPVIKAIILQKHGKVDFSVEWYGVDNTPREVYHKFRYTVGRDNRPYYAMYVTYKDE